MSGIELVRRIKALDRETKIIAISANRETDSLVSAIELGFSDYLLKPLEIKDLLLAVKRCYDEIAVKNELKSERENFFTVVECLGDGISIKDLDFRITFQNRTMTEIFGDRIGSSCYQMFGFESPCPDCPTVKALHDQKTHTSCRSHNINGKTMHIESTASLLRDSQGIVTGTVEIVRDVSERIKNEEAIRDLALHDPLTGLANRRLFEDRLEQAIAKSNRYGRKFALIYLDLDPFKEINDAFGHEAGDKVLLEAAERIRGCCKRDLDTICRLRGDEFCIIVTDCGDRDKLTPIADKLLEEFARPFDIDKAEVSVTASIGITIFPDNSTVMKELQIDADRAMYAAKKAGRNRYCFWESI